MNFTEPADSDKLVAKVEAHMNIRREVSMHLGRRNHK
jgi:hypothetical protein